MPIEFEVEHEQRLVISRATGHVGMTELADYFGKVWTQDDHRGYSEIFDWSGADGVKLNVAELRSLSGAARTFYDPSVPSRLALVVPRDDKKGASLYRTLRELRSKKGPEIQIFEELEPAKVWMEERPPA